MSTNRSRSKSPLNFGEIRKLEDVKKRIEQPDFLQKEIKSEFEKLSKETSGNSTTGFKKENEDRNIEKNIVPYDTNRVKLDKANFIIKNDYVNASLVRDKTKDLNLTHEVIITGKMGF